MEVTTPGTGEPLPTTTTRTTATLSSHSSRITREEHVTIEEVFDAYYDCRRHKRSKQSAVRYELDYELGNYRLWQELNGMTYSPTVSTAFCVTKPKLREVFAADFRDRIVHHLLYNKLNWMFEAELTDCAFACRKGKGTLYGARYLRQTMDELGGDAWYVKCDVSGFFMAIDRDILFREVERIMRKYWNDGPLDWWLWLSRTVIMHRPEQNCEIHGNARLWEGLSEDKSLFCSDGVGLPIGNLTSQVFANVYMGIFDRWILSRLGGGGRYGRYVDDFIIIHPDRRVLMGLLGEARDFLGSELKLRLHPRKVTVQQVRRGVQFTGTYIKSGLLLPGRRLKSRAVGAAEGWTGGDADCLRRKVCSLNSYYGLLIHLSSYRLRKKMWRSLGSYEHLNLINNKKLKIVGL